MQTSGVFIAAQQATAGSPYLRPPNLVAGLGKYATIGAQALGQFSAPTLEAYGGAKTTGIIRIGGSDTRLVSGYAGPSAAMPRGTPGMDNIVKSHVEAHAASIMRVQGVQKVTLYINRVPCGGVTGCGRMLPRMLPPNAKLKVVGPNGYRKTFVGDGN